MTVLRIAAGALGLLTVLLTIGSAVRTVVLPRGVRAGLTRFVFLVTRALFRLRAGRTPSYERRDRVFASYAPVSLLVLAQVWLALAFTGFAALDWAAGAGSVRRAVALSGSSLFTLGTVVPHGAPLSALSYAEASAGLVLLALLITYLPSLYGAFSRREAAVTKLEVRAGSPPSGAELLWRAGTLGIMDVATDMFREWEGWFVDVQETHTSFPALAFFRSPQPEHSWVTAAGAVLDAASLLASSVPGERVVEAELVVRAGSLALRRIADYFRIRYPVDPVRGDPVTVGRDEWQEAVERLAAAGLAVRPDRDEAWLDFAGWRVNYDAVLVALAALTQAPYAPWSSDRSLSRGLAPLDRLSIPRAGVTGSR